jgi:sialate O-acetylesterase
MNILAPRLQSATRLAAALLCLAARGNAAVTLPRIFGDNMVFQSDMPAPVWGQADPGEEVTVSFQKQVKHTRADGSGKWRVFLEPLRVTAEPHDFSIVGANTVVFRNVVVGEVWLAAGQSNMEYSVGIDTKNIRAAAKTDARLADDLAGPGIPGIRLFRVEKTIRPPDVVSSGWTEPHGEALAKFSAIGYLFARHLQGKIGVPIGVIEAAWGGTRAEAWTPAEAYARSPAFEQEANRVPVMVDGSAPGRNYSAMVGPIIPFSVRGVLWYQGESNIIECNDGLRYADKMEALVDGWRRAWGTPNLPFLVVQVAPYSYSERKGDKMLHEKTALPELWEAQVQLQKLPGIALVPTTDLVQNLHDIHPHQKRPVAERLVAAALSQVYGREDPKARAPVADHVEFRDGKVLVHFQPAGRLRSSDGKPLSWFEIQGQNGRFVPAEATLDGPNIVVVSSGEVSAPQAVRFAWNELAQPNLVNADGWPALPFRAPRPIWEPQTRNRR